MYSGSANKEWRRKIDLRHLFICINFIGPIHLSTYIWCF